MKPETAKLLREAVDTFRANGSKEFRDLSMLAHALAVFAEDVLAEHPAADLAGPTRPEGRDA